MSIDDIISRKARNTDLNNIQQLLDDNQLPIDDCSVHLKNFIVLEHNEKIIVVGGIEIFHDLGLIRSITVNKRYRNSGLGKHMCQLISDKAVSQGIKRLYLLTETAQAFFEGQGFRVIDRANAPAEIKSTQQFDKLCPSSAVLMLRSI